MNKQEYEYLQELFTKKLRGSNKLYITNKEESYNKGVLSCKSILSNYYNSSLDKD